jgi:hypothetical protein
MTDYILTPQLVDAIRSLVQAEIKDISTNATDLGGESKEAWDNLKLKLADAGYMSRREALKDIIAPYRRGGHHEKADSYQYEDGYCLLCQLPQRDHEEGKCPEVPKFDCGCVPCTCIDPKECRGRRGGCRGWPCLTHDPEVGVPREEGSP